MQDELFSIKEQNNNVQNRPSFVQLRLLCNGSTFLTVFNSCTSLHSILTNNWESLTGSKKQQACLIGKTKKSYTIDHQSVFRSWGLNTNYMPHLCTHILLNFCVIPFLLWDCKTIYRDLLIQPNTRLVTERGSTIFIPSYSSNERRRH